jgi:hypothetical protein
LPLEARVDQGDREVTPLGGELVVPALAAPGVIPEGALADWGEDPVPG